MASSTPDPAADADAPAAGVAAARPAAANPAAAPAAAAPALVAPISLAEQVARTRSGERSLDDAIAESLARLDQANPQIRAVLPDPRRRERLDAEARSLENAHPDPARRPPLYGAIILIKDIINVDRMPTRAGSAVPPESFSGPEAEAVRRLRNAGALILGKSVTTEFAYFAPGATANPHDLQRTPGGSSSGSAAAVAAGIAPLALGSQTVGSVIRPAAFCGVVGFKPSFDRIPTDGVLMYSPSVDHLGLFTRAVDDAILAAKALLTGWRQGEDAEAPKPRIGIPTGPYLEQASKSAQRALQQAADQLRDAGLDVQPTPALADIADINQLHRDLATREFALQHEDRYRRYGAMFRPESAALYLAGLQLSDEQAQAGRQSRINLRQRLHQHMDRAQIDLWLSPAAKGPAPKGLHSTGDPAMNLPWTHAGMPVISIPIPRRKLPQALQLTGRFGHDETLLAQAKHIESALT